MASLANWLFKIGYYPIHHNSVKHDFLRWYHKAAQHHQIRDGLDYDNAKLVSLTLEAASHAENFSEESPVISMFEYIDDVAKKAETWFHYLAVGSGIIAGCSIAISWHSFQGLLFYIFATIGSVVLGCGVMAISLYHVIKHQLRTNAELISLFNEALTERPGHVRRYDREWEMLVAQYLWNRSLSKPRTINVLILLSVIRVVSARLYGQISADLQDNIQDFIGMNGKEIIKHQLDRLASEIPQSYQHQQTTVDDSTHSNTRK